MKWNSHQVKIYPTAQEAALQVAQRVAEVIREKQKRNQWAVLGLATGKTPVKVYEELIRLHQQEQLSFENVISFNLDEYFPMAATHPQSYHHFMQQQLFDQVNIPPEQTHIPKGDWSTDQLQEACLAYEERIKQVGGIDLQLLGIGKTGHIGFNEPGSSIDTTTRQVVLDPLTRQEAIADFGSLEQVPSQAITVGIETIAQAREIVLMAWNASKASIVQQAIQGPVSAAVPASYLQLWPQASFVLDQDTAALL